MKISIPRLHLFEFCDLEGLPKVLRRLFHEVLVFSANVVKTNKEVPKIISLFAQMCEAKTILELASGNGESISNAMAQISIEQRPKLLLSDLSPQVESYKALSEKYGAESVEYVGESVSYFQDSLPQADAMIIDRACHHLKPAELRELFRNILSQSNGILCIEAFQRSLLALIGLTITAPLFAFGSALNPRTVSFAGIFFTWIIPVVPLIFWWDSIVSVLRCYTEQELRELVPKDSKLSVHYGTHGSFLGISSTHFWIFKS